LVYVYIDHSNVVIKGKYTVGAFENIYDQINERFYISQFKIDFGCLLTIIQRNCQLGSNPMIVGSRPPKNDSVWKKIEEQGYKAEVFDQEKFKDNQIAISMVIDTLIKVKKPGILVLVAGNGNFEPVLRPIMEVGWIVEVRF
jgi:hypothetical protein